eukprot:SAG11_NODE_3004_length_2774_cov_1.712897_3_plen_223_part_00
MMSKCLRRWNSRPISIETTRTPFSSRMVVLLSSQYHAQTTGPEILTDFAAKQLECVQTTGRSLMRPSQAIRDLFTSAHVAAVPRALILNVAPVLQLLGHGLWNRRHAERCRRDDQEGVSDLPIGPASLPSTTDYRSPRPISTVLSSSTSASSRTTSAAATAAGSSALCVSYHSRASGPTNCRRDRTSRLSSRSPPKPHSSQAARYKPATTTCRLRSRTLVSG